MSLLLLLAACGTRWSSVDADGDGAPFGVDCDDLDPEVGPAMIEVWYDGVDQDCDGNDQDQDGDGVPQAEDCWDTPGLPPAELQALPGFRQPAAHEVHPGAAELWYDGVDQDCAGDDDFDQDGDGFPLEEDCADAADQVLAELDCGETEVPSLDPAEIHPGATEAFYDGVDQDCAGDDDFDQDGDGFALCEECADEDPAVFPDPSALDTPYDCRDTDCDGNDADVDGDGWVPLGYEADCLAMGVDPSAFSAHVNGEGDCWDGGADPDFSPLNGAAALAAGAVHPGSTDAAYDGIDADCAGDSDFDADGDGHDSAAWAQRDGTLGDDCDDASAAVSPSAPEDCATAADDDCDGATDEAGALGCGDLFADRDGDGFGAGAALCLCAADGEWSSALSTDCDDADADDHPGATEEIANEDDEDCDGGELCIADDDGDGFGGSSTATSTDTDCADPGEATGTDDCDDADAGISPSATEGAADGVDQDCDGGEICWADLDLDGVGGTSTVASADLSCAAAGESDLDTDCDDGDDTVAPGATEVCDGLDHDCDGALPTCSPVGTVALSAADAVLGGAGDAAGSSVAFAGDVDGDGLEELLVGDPDGAGGKGRGYLLENPSGAVALASGYTRLVRGSGADHAGSSVAGGGDLGSDGVPDFVVGSESASTVWVVAGGGAAIFVLTGSAAILTGVQGNPSLAAASDLDGDGLADLVVGAPADTDGGTDAGAAWALPGPVSSGVVGTVASTGILGDAGAQLGACVAAVGDSDGDGLAELLVGAPGADGGAAGSGGAWLYELAGASSSLAMADAEAALLAPGAGDAAGACGAPGDVDGDGRDDLLIGAAAADDGGADAGAAWLVLGPVSGEVDLSGAEARILGVAGDQLGFALAGAGDVNGDSLGDLLIGAPGASSGAGEALLFLAPLSGALAAADATAQFTGAAGQGAGVAVAGGGDADGDGFSDLLIGSSADAAWLVLGGP